MTKIFVSGASGNVGATIIRFINSRENLELAGGFCKEDGEDLGLLAGLPELGLKATNNLEAGITASKPDVVIDFSATPILKQNLEVYLKHGLKAVIGTTGLNADEIEELRARVLKQGLRWAVIPNFGLGISLISEFIKTARKYYPYATVTDQHHVQMANAPSGTAAALAELLAESPQGEVKSVEVYPGVLGADIAGIPVFSERLPLPGPYSNHIITLGRKDEIIKIEVTDFTSDVYMDGVFIAAAKLESSDQPCFLTTMAEAMA